MSAYWCELAWLDGVVEPGVLVEHVDGVVTAVERHPAPPRGATRLGGLTLPGMADVHSHAFHRALRGRTHQGPDGGRQTFWTWRRTMYDLASRLDPDRYLQLATAVYAELVCAGWTAVGEFHYLPELTEAVREAARLAGIRLVLLETLYLTGGIDRPLEGVQQRFSLGGFDGWAARVREGAAVHSLRAVPLEALALVRDVVGYERPLHVHVSEQQAENDACRTEYRATPTGLLADAGLLRPTTTAVHATHLTPADVMLLGASGTGVCMCPSTEADLADGIGPARELADEGCPISLGTDAHAVVDPFAEARGLEYGERLRSGRRSRFSPAELVGALTGHRALGLPGGAIAVGAPCDLVATDTGSPRTAGSDPGQLPMVASAADVHTVVIGGAVIAESGVHTTLGPPGPLLAAAVGAAWSAPVVDRASGRR